MTRRRMTRPHPMALVVALILVAGTLWAVADLATDAPPPAASDTYDRIDAYVADQLQDARIPGAALAVVENGKAVHVNGFGTDGHGNRVTADTPFWIGSNTKSFTALAVMQLVEDGVLDLDAPVQQYLPEFHVADPAASARITVRHLLNQTSGVSRTDGARAVARGGTGSMRDTVASMGRLHLDRPVGQSFEYANLNSVVLGVVVEQVTGRTWQDYVEQRILEPLGMDRTFTDQSAARDAGLTSTYRSFFGFPLETDAPHLDGLAASGYLYSTAGDLSRYLSAYLDGGSTQGRQVLGAASVEQMLASATDPRTFTLQGQQFTAGYGAGWFVGPFGGVDGARWHQGSLPHFTSWMVLLPDSDQAVVLLLNRGNQLGLGGADAAWSRIPQGVVSLLVGNDPAPGGGSATFTIGLVTFALALVTMQAWRLVTLVRRGIPPSTSTRRAAVPLIWELGVAATVLLVYPSLLGGLGWSATFAFLPDLTLTVVVIGGLALTCGAVRTALLVSRHTMAGPARPTAAPEGVGPAGTRSQPAVVTTR